MWGVENIYDSVTELKRIRVKGRLCFLGIINYGGNFTALGLYSIFCFVLFLEQYLGVLT